ncbi:hypothetical protein HU200_005692 [Digitaria exilis]|uniref:AAA+ ATPase domain-containing protein n=1 Tax=Digitaria exilis TaxID=1010633 RepID=A0A835FRC9_9POAL|nr:hypothetical protein HU200_005692 [Digitaria exilis]
MDPVIGRDVEIDRVVCTLCRRTKSNAMLVGAPGLEQRLKSVIREAEDADGKVILFIDEMHMLISIGGKSNVNAANVLKPALARGRVRCVGATTLEEYRKYVEKDPALERRFQRIHVEEPSTEATVEIVRGLKRRKRLSRQFPDKAIDLIDEACATMRIQIDKQKEVDASREVLVKKKKAIVLPEHVAQVVSLWTGIPVYTIGQEEKDKLIHLAERLHERVVGQDEAVNLVAQAVLRTRAGLDRSGQPIGCFLFLGSTGVGKTELAKALAEQLFDSEKFLIRLDMSEFVGAGSVLRLIGAPPSYIGQLTEKVRRRPYSVILFDEVEKADPSVFNAILQLLDDGVLTDGKGRTVDFKNTLIIMTSNLGAEHLAEAILMDGEETMEAARDLVMKQVHRHFKPEFLNRLSDVVIFEPLSRDKLKEVVKIQMKSIVANVAHKGIFLSVSDDALDVIFSESYQPANKKVGAKERDDKTLRNANQRRS